jgi:hypothetical protein
MEIGRAFYLALQSAFQETPLQFDMQAIINPVLNQWETLCTPNNEYNSVLIWHQDTLPREEERNPTIVYLKQGISGNPSEFRAHYCDAGKWRDSLHTIDLSGVCIENPQISGWNNKEDVFKIMSSCSCPQQPKEVSLGNFFSDHMITVGNFRCSSAFQRGYKDISVSLKDGTLSELKHHLVNGEDAQIISDRFSLPDFCRLHYMQNGIWHLQSEDTSQPCFLKDDIMISQHQVEEYADALKQQQPKPLLTALLCDVQDACASSALILSPSASSAVITFSQGANSRSSHIVADPEISGSLDPVQTSQSGCKPD